MNKKVYMFDSPSPESTESKLHLLRINASSITLLELWVSLWEFWADFIVTTKL